MLIRLSIALFCFFLFPVNAIADVTAIIEAEAIVLSNESTQTICYAVHEDHKLALIEWAPGCEEDNRVQAGQSTTIPFTKDRYKPSGIAVVSWWDEGRNVVSGHIRLVVFRANAEGP